MTINQLHFRSKYAMFLLFILLVLHGCGGGDVTSSSDQFMNPDTNFPSHNVVESGEGSPYPTKQFPYEDSGVKTLVELEAFCSSIREHFSISGLSYSEAEQIYTVLEQLNLADGSYGMPSPDHIIPEYILRERVLIKKIEYGTYEIFYDRFSCGRKYYHRKIVIEESEIIENQLIEQWTESFPC